MSYRPSTAAFIVASLFLTGLGSGAFAGSAAADRARSPYEGLDVLARVLTLIEERYVEERDPQDIVNAAVRGMMRDLDEHSIWMDPETYRAFRDETHGSYEGIGIEIEVRPEGVEVIRVLAHGPAERDGLLAGDLLLSANGVPLAGLDIDGVLKQMTGPRGTQVDLTVRRATSEQLLRIQTTRDRIYTPSVEASRIGTLAYVRLVQFQDNSAKDLQDRLADLEVDGAPTGLILDLRDNPGGLLTEAVAVSDLFLDEGPIVSTRGRSEGEHVYTATPGGLPADLPLVVLVNGMSASAAEIVTGALQDTSRATIMGTATYGKGSVQTIFENPDDSAVKLTIGAYFTPSGEPVAPHSGRVPDVVIPMTKEPGPRDRLVEALHNASGLTDEERVELIALAEALPADDTKSVPVPWSLEPASRLDQDPQLAAAVKRLSR